MRNFLRVFKVPLIILGVVLILLGAISIRCATTPSYESHSVADTTQRVFDYGDKLTDVQEAKLQKLIEKRQAQCQLDIVIVTQKDSISDYSGSRDYRMRDWADDFYDTHQFGFDGYDTSNPYSGDGVLLLDNWYYDYIWMSTSGTAETFYERNGGKPTTHAVDIVGDLDMISPYLAYKTFVNTIYYDQTGWIGFYEYVYPAALCIIPIIIAFVWLAAVKKSAKAKDTVAETNYVVGGRPDVYPGQDIFLRKSVSSYRVSSSGGGGSHGGHSGAGGHHHSSGGHSHGGHGGGH